MTHDDVIVGIEESTRDDDEALTKFSKHHHYETSSSLWRKQQQATTNAHTRRQEVDEGTNQKILYEISCDTRWYKIIHERTIWTMMRLVRITIREWYSTSYHHHHHHHYRHQTDEDVSINNLRMSIVYHRVTVKSNSLFRKWVCRFIGQIYIFQVSALVLLVREIIVAIHRRRICGQLNWRGYYKELDVILS